MLLKTCIAFFISPTGDLIYVPTSHISTVINDPEMFGLTREEIHETYSRCGEKIGAEGYARRELLLKVIQQGWLGIRGYRQHWSITAPSLSPDIQEHLRDRAAQMLSGITGFQEQDRYMPVRLSTSEGELHCTIKDLANGSRPR